MGAHNLVVDLAAVYRPIAAVVVAVGRGVVVPRAGGVCAVVGVGRRIVGARVARRGCIGCG